MFISCVVPLAAYKNCTASQIACKRSCSSMPADRVCKLCRCRQCARCSSHVDSKASVHQKLSLTGLPGGHFPEVEILKAGGEPYYVGVRLMTVPHHQNIRGVPQPISSGTDTVALAWLRSTQEGMGIADCLVSGSGSRASILDSESTRALRRTLRTAVGLTHGCASLPSLFKQNWAWQVAGDAIMQQQLPCMRGMRVHGAAQTDTLALLFVSRRNESVTAAEHHAALGAALAVANVTAWLLQPSRGDMPSTQGGRVYPRCLLAPNASRKGGKPSVDDTASSCSFGGRLCESKAGQGLRHSCADMEAIGAALTSSIAASDSGGGGSSSPHTYVCRSGDMPAAMRTPWCGAISRACKQSDGRKGQARAHLGHRAESQPTGQHEWATRSAHTLPSSVMAMLKLGSQGARHTETKRLSATPLRRTRSS